MITLPREICRNLDAVLQREWLVTNGLGSYASGTVSGANTRRYHGLLVAALRPPVARTVMVAKVGEEVEFDQRTFYLGTNEYQDGTIHPGGFVHLESFALEDGLPVFLYRIGGPNHLMLEKRIWMEHRQQTTYVRYRLLREPAGHKHLSLEREEHAAQPQSGEQPLSSSASRSGASSSSITLTVLPFTAYRDYHGQQYGSAEQHFAVAPLQPALDGQSSGSGQSTGQAPLAGCTITAFEGARPFHLVGLGAHTAPVFTTIGVWYWRFLHRIERERGLPDTEDYYLPGAFRVELRLPEHSKTGADTFTLAITAEPRWSTLAHSAALGKAEQRALARQREIKRSQHSGISERDAAFLQQLRLAADQFMVTRASSAGRQGARQTHPSIIAGYHWFTDWSRDTMISLPGLTLATGRFEEARALLETFARYLNRGMLPNRFPDSGEDLTDADYNTADATLWYFHALDQYLRVSGDSTLLARLFPALEEIVAWHQRGTRFNIHVDERDGLLTAGEPGVQLTWMDAKVDEWVVTPRMGKPVEINALWYNALRLMEAWAVSQGKDPLPYGKAAAHCRESFNRRFWYEPGAHLYDVLDGPGGDDSSLRPNQLFALSLPYPILETNHWERMLETVTRYLLTPLGLRTLDQSHPDYRGHITGDRHARDGAYHQGTVWAWLIGPYLDARLRVYGAQDETALRHEEEHCRGMLEAFHDHLSQYGLGTVSEIFDGDAPHTARGCIAQAWSVAEVLRLWCRCLHIIPAPATTASAAGRARSRSSRRG
ncbi:MAG TPA: amylo-alpha-1,6-glucosidase [Ktedonobacterales bacterium]|jgi:predicted glycogen debranching enzyme